MCAWFGDSEYHKNEVFSWWVTDQDSECRTARSLRFWLPISCYKMCGQAFNQMCESAGAIGRAGKVSLFI